MRGHGSLKKYVYVGSEYMIMPCRFFRTKKALEFGILESLLSGTMIKNRSSLQDKVYDVNKCQSYTIMKANSVTLNGIGLVVTIFPIFTRSVFLTVVIILIIESTLDKSHDQRRICT